MSGGWGVGDFPDCPWLRLYPSTARSTNLIPAQRTKILHATSHGQGGEKEDLLGQGSVQTQLGHSWRIKGSGLGVPVFQSQTHMRVLLFPSVKWG